MVSSTTAGALSKLPQDTRSEACNRKEYDAAKRKVSNAATASQPIEKNSPDKHMSSHVYIQEMSGAWEMTIFIDLYGYWENHTLSCPKGYQPHTRLLYQESSFCQPHMPFV